MAWIAGLAVAGAGILGSSMAQQGQQQTNAQMMAQNKQIMDWETMMSDTAMSRRVIDLKSAGLNPYLAVQEGGASTPGAGPAALGNPGQSWANLGSTAASAISTGMQASVQQAQARNIDADTESKQIDNIKKDPRQAFSGGALGASAPISPAQVDYAASVSNAQRAGLGVSGDSLRNQTLAYQLENILPTQAAILNVDKEKATQILPYAVDVARQEAKMMDLGIPEAQAKSNYYSSAFGKYDPAFQRVLEAVGVAGGVFGLAKGMRAGAGSAVGAASGRGAASGIGGQTPGINPSGSDRMGNIDQYLGGD